MTDSHIVTLTQIKEFIKVDTAIKFKALSKKEKYEWINEVLVRFKYFTQRKKDKGIVREYIIKMTGLSCSQLTRLIARKKKFGKVFHDTQKRHRFPKKYNSSDVARLIETDNAHERLSGSATKSILQREYDKFNKREYKNIKNVSVSHIYNLRRTRQYQSHSLTVKKTQSRQVPHRREKKTRTRRSTRLSKSRHSTSGRLW